ncbi:MAG TPA: type III secretion system inner membrane ring subunit SctD [Geminicoccaceae bacterium]|nr:type III secretion system inner membrane ring subunit SctD [Geminicoccaceae bacterium]
MQQSGPYYILKVLSGPHLGAEVRLAEGEYRVGRDETCDIVLSDRSLAGEHALIAIGADGIRAQSLAGEVRLDHRPHADPGKLLSFFTVLGLGTTHLAVGPEAGNWPELLPPALPTAPAAVEAGQTQAAAPTAPSTGPAERPDGAAPAATGTASPTAPPAARSATVGARVRRWAARAAAVVVLLAVATAVGSSRTGPDRPAAPSPEAAAAEPAPPTPKELLLSMLAEDGWGRSLSVSEDRRGRLTVEGHVATLAEQQALLEQMKGAPVPAQVRVFSGEEMVAGARQTLQALGYELEVGYVADGVLRLQGYIPEASDLQRVVDIVQRDVAGLSSVHNEVLTDRAILTLFEGELKSAGLGETIRLRLESNRQITARGTARPEEMQLWAQLQESFDERFGRYLKIVSQVGETRREMALPGVQLNVRAIGFGELPFVILGDGEKYLEGSVLTDGWTILKIGRSEIVLSRGGQLFVHEL